MKWNNVKKGFNVKSTNTVSAMYYTNTIKETQQSYGLIKVTRLSRHLAVEEINKDIPLISTLRVDGLSHRLLFSLRNKRFRLSLRPICLLRWLDLENFEEYGRFSLLLLFLCLFFECLSFRAPVVRCSLLLVPLSRRITLDWLVLLDLYTISLLCQSSILSCLLLYDVRWLHLPVYRPPRSR